MKSIKDLQAIRERALDSVNMRKDQDGIRIVAVSYTHLDVYKRQPLRKGKR